MKRDLIWRLLAVAFIVWGTTYTVYHVGSLALQAPVLVTFVVVLAASVVMPRAWCKFVCPNRGLFELLCGRKSTTNCTNEDESNK